MDRQRVFRAAAAEEEPGFRLCLITLLYLLYVDTAELGAPLSPLELPGATTFSKAGGPMRFPAPPWKNGLVGIYPGSCEPAASWERKGAPAVTAPWPSSPFRG